MKNKEKIKKIWEKALKIAENDENLAEKLYPALVKEYKAKQKVKAIKNKEKAKERKRRTRALILLALYTLQKAKENDFSAKELLRKLEKERKYLIAREGRAEIDYFPYLRKEIERLGISITQKTKTKISFLKK